MERLGLIRLIEAGKMIGYNSINTIKAWCQKNKVTVYRNVKGNAVNFLEFEIAVNRPLIESLRKQYGEAWENIYKSLLAGDIKGAVYLNSSKAAPGATLDKSKELKSENGQGFFKRLNRHGNAKN